MSTSSTNTLGKYQIVREIARSNDVVYEAIDPSINRRIALKELYMPPTLQGAQKRERIERFWREGKAAGRLSHPNIVTIFEVGKDGDRHFIAMEYLEGQTLRDAIQAGGPMPLQTAKDYALQLCNALAYAHSNGVVHRDIKPDNVQILPGGHVKLTDFGIARLMGEASITQDGQVFGTPSYMSPEQVSGRNIDTRSDIFSLGVLIYEMVAGKKPFAGDSVVTITYNIMNMEAPPPPGAPPYLTGIIRKAMAKDPDMRYQTVEQLAEDLKSDRCSDMFMPDMNAASPYPSPFGMPHQQQPQRPSVPITPYGTPFPSQGAGAPSGGVPDPFAQNMPAPSPMPPPGPPQPVMSAETRNFLGVFLVIIGIAGMLAFAIWVLNLAYSSYATAQNTQAATRYYNQGVKLLKESKMDEAEEQFQNAVRVCPDSKIAESAKDGIYKVWIARAYTYSQVSDKDALADLAPRMIEIRPTAPEGHYYQGLVLEMEGRLREAVDAYEKASTLAGADQAGYGAAARTRRDALSASIQNSPPSNSSGNAPSPAPRPRASDIPFQPGSQSQ